MASTDAFLNRGERVSRRLKKWGEKGFLEFWLWCVEPPQVLWKHKWNKLEPRRDPKTGTSTVEVWSDDVVCLEDDDGDESVLEQRFFRHADDSRKNPPLHCPMCRLDEAIYQALRAGKLKPEDVLFHFPGTMKTFNGRSWDTTVTVHAAGACGLWRKLAEKFDSKSEEYRKWKEDLATKKIFLKESYKEDIRVKQFYLMQGVDQGDQGKGLQVSQESAGVGNKLKHLIRQTRKSLAKYEGDLDSGDPFLNPYCVRFEYLKDAADPKDTYQAMRMERYPLTENIAHHVRGPGIDTKSYYAEKNLATLQSQVEQRATPALKAAVDLAEVFRVVPREPKKQEMAATIPNRVVVPLPAATSASKVEMIPCDNPACKKPMPADASTCNACGTKYIVESDPVPVVAAPVHASAGGGGSDDFGANEAFDDDIPFIFLSNRC